MIMAPTQWCRGRNWKGGKSISSCDKSLVLQRFARAIANSVQLSTQHVVLEASFPFSHLGMYAESARARVVSCLHGRQT